MSDGITISSAARMLKRSESTIRRWVQRGCPCVRPGETGRGKGAILNLSDVMRWRGGGVAEISPDERLQSVATVLMDCLKRDGIHERIGITGRELAGLLVLVFERYYKNLLHEPVNPEKLPPEIVQLLAVWVE